MLLLIALAILGHGIRLAVTDPGDPPGAVTLLPARDSASLGAHRDRVARLMRPLAQGEHVYPGWVPAWPRPSWPTGNSAAPLAASRALIGLLA